MITAPYNFVPLNEKIFYPPWASEDILKNIHDVPFKDGESGIIEVEITAKSPIFIKDSKNRTEFCHFTNENGGKEYYIPATSVKGMIRNVLEIMSFSKIRIDEGKHKKHLSVRDMTDRKNLVGQADGCGFLVKNGNSYMIEECVDIRTINLRNDTNYKDIKKLETAKEKYTKFGLLKEINFTPYNEKSKNRSGQNITIKRAKFDRQGRIGILVFTGQIGNKTHEFVFAKSGNKIALDKNIFENFKSVYFDDEESIDGQFWKKQFNKGTPVPIFYNKDKTVIGLTQLFKLAYKKTIFEAAKQESDETKFDLAETIFGTVKGKKALKGRVYFSHFKSAIERFEAQKTEQGIFGTPNPSYYPNYLEQNGGKYITLMDTTARIRGYKRYPLHSGVEQLNIGNGNKDMVVEFKPLPANSVFKGKIAFHNLKKVEIGALISAITFHGLNDKCMHNIGFAKPYGYGKIDIKLTLKDLEYSQDEYLKEFEKKMNEFVPNWLKEKQLTELRSMASTNYKASNILRYQKLGDGKNGIGNEFTNAKKNHEFLLPHSGNAYKTSSSEIKSQNTQKPSTETNGIDIGSFVNFNKGKK
ncbi:TIGR03986 family CRISPR-associated RAMP protein [Campylobacter concisus]|uniref:TIGR03986 family type III CRISPR-associated RAMP protein n=1 Tax=Campylobacter concisus TaxID=199 RepID=UPI00188401B2|nr:TIGR03986 family CRISPR-associated RAMP protein [Campylobacter concisus]MBE9864281.1 TIGR03986 family CRISPR-associated RAMP protein [Campylobacter concisus]